MKKIVTFAIGGTGDVIQAFQISHFINQKVGPDNTEVICLSRDEVFEPIKLLFGDKFTVYQHELKERWGENYEIITNPLILKEEKDKYSEIIVSAPDLLFRAREYSFNFNKYNCSPQSVVQTRLLTHLWNPENIIYCAFCNTTTKGYNFPQSKKLIELLATLLPNYKFYVPVLLNWNNETIIDAEKNAELKNLPSNVLVDFNPPWERALSFMSKSCYGIALDSAPYHLFYQFGIERLCLDPRFGSGHINKMWQSRWRNIGMHDSVPISSPAESIAQLVYTNIMVMQTTLLPKWHVMNEPNENWQMSLGFKF